MASNWISYNELAWIDDYLSDPKDYEHELNEYINLINSTSKQPVRTLLHLGCGAGGHDIYFKKHYQVIGVDISKGMLDIAKVTNPEIEYIEADMRDVRLNRLFDCVVIPDSIDYLVTFDDLLAAIQTSAIHLKPGGVFMIVAKTKETFQNNNFAYTGEKGNTHVTVFENNFINPYEPNTYRITLIYLIRQGGILSKYIEETTAGLFPKNTWDKLFDMVGFKMETRDLDGIYDKFLLGDGKYTQTIFIGNKV